MSAYFIFLNDRRAALLSENKNVLEVAKITGEEWKNMPEHHMNRTDGVEEQRTIYARNGIVQAEDGTLSRRRILHFSMMLIDIVGDEGQSKKKKNKQVHKIS